MQSVSSPAGTFSYTYQPVNVGGSSYAAGRVQQLDLPGSLKIVNDFTDPLARLIKTEFRDSANVVKNSHQYTYNHGSQRTSHTRGGNGHAYSGTSNYTYDDLGQLLSASLESLTYGYDPGWNMTSRNTTTYTVNDRNQVTYDGSWSYSYDANGNRTYRTSGSGWLQYTWDDENRLVTVQTDTYRLEDYRFKTELVYDDLARLRRVRTYTWQYGGWYGPMSDLQYIYDGMLVIQERTSSHIPRISYTRGLDLSGTLAGASGIGGLLARSRHTTSSPYAVNGNSFYHADGNGNVTYLAHISGGADAAYRYDPFGRWLAQTGPDASANVMRFSSKPWLAHNSLNTDGLYSYGYRFYDPLTQRWLNRDPIEELGSYNLYGFVGNNPISRVDILGLIPPMDIPYWPPQPPPTPRPKPPQYPEGFAMCQRDVAVDGPSDSVGKCCNAFGGQHTYLQYVNTPQPSEQRPPLIWGWGAGGTRRAAEGHFAPDSCKPCTKYGNALKFGSGAGKGSNSATDDEIRDCIMNRKPTRFYSFPRYVCTGWVKEAAADCGLTCK